MKLLLLSLIFVFSSLLHADESFKKEAGKLASSLKMGLVTTLTMKIKELGVKEAVPFCHEKVGELGKMAVGDMAFKYEFGRTSHLIRNEKNNPQDWMNPYLEKFKGTTQTKKPKIVVPIVTKLKSGELAYLEPLYVMPMCLQCHGENISQDVKEKIKTLYPKDQAKGFKVGDFRGFIWVKQKQQEKPMGRFEKISGVPSLIVQTENDLKDFDLLIDVRRPDEYTGELGHIQGAKLVTLGEELSEFLEKTPKDKKILFICRSGVRSETATKEAISKGFTQTVNMTEGMIGWNQKKLETER